MFSLYSTFTLTSSFSHPVPPQILLLFTHTHTLWETHTHSLTVTKVGLLLQAAGGGLSCPNSPNAEVAELWGTEIHRKRERIGWVGWPPANPRAVRGGGAGNRGMGDGRRPTSSSSLNPNGWYGCLHIHTHPWVWMDTHVQRHNKYTLAGSYFTARKPTRTGSTTHWGELWRCSPPNIFIVIHRGWILSIYHEKCSLN